MISDLVQHQILSLSSGGLSAERIAADMEIPIESIKLVLSANKAGTAADRDINDEDLGKIRLNLRNLALGAADEGIQARVGMFLLERDKPKNTQANSTGIIAINNAINLGRGAYEELMKDYAAGK